MGKLGDVQGEIQCRLGRRARKWMGVVGSGYADGECVDQDLCCKILEPWQYGLLSILTSSQNQDPVVGQFRPILGIDAWEHAY